MNRAMMRTWNVYALHTQPHGGRNLEDLIKSDGEIADKVAARLRSAGHTEFVIESRNRAFFYAPNMARCDVIYNAFYDPTKQVQFNFEFARRTSSLRICPN